MLPTYSCVFLLKLLVRRKANMQICFFQQIMNLTLIFGPMTSILYQLLDRIYVYLPSICVSIRRKVNDILTKRLCVTDGLTSQRTNQPTNKSIQRVASQSLDASTTICLRAVPDEMPAKKKPKKTGEKA